MDLETDRVFPNLSIWKRIGLGQPPTLSPEILWRPSTTRETKASELSALGPKLVSRIGVPETPFLVASVGPFDVG